MSLSAPEVVKSAEAAKSTLFANVFNASEKTRVEMRIGKSDWVEMRHVREIDPAFQRVFDRETATLEKDKSAFRALSKPKPSSHLWRVSLPTNLKPGTHSIEVRATEPDGRVYRDRRIIRVTK